MQRLKDRLETNTDAEIIRTAIRFLHLLVEDHKMGMGLFISPQFKEPYFLGYANISLQFAATTEVAKKRPVCLSQHDNERLQDIGDYLDIKSESAIVKKALLYLDYVYSQFSQSAEIVHTDGVAKIYPYMMRPMQG